MLRLQRTILLVLVLCVYSTSSFAMPIFLQAFQRDPFRRADRDGCVTCHVDPNGGGPRNPFGQAFESGGEVFTPMLRAQFPDRFAYPTSQAGSITFHFSDPANKLMVVENSGARMLVDIAMRSVDGRVAAQAGGTVAAGNAVEPARASSAVTTPIDPYAHEGVFLGMQVVNLPNGKPQRKGGVDFIVEHRFRQPVYQYDAQGERRWSSMLGFDSSAFISYGARVGIANRVSVGFLRSSLDRTLEVNSAIHVVRQGDKSPVTFGVRSGFEVRYNFRKQPTPKTRRVAEFIQPVLTSTVANRVSLTMSPTFAFNTRDEYTFQPPDLVFGGDHNNTIALGLGAGIRVTPTTSIVGEYIPRLWGFKGEVKDRPGVSMALEKSTFRHTFALVLSRQLPMTTTQYAVQGTDIFSVGFNIFRKIR